MFRKPKQRVQGGAGAGAGRRKTYAKRPILDDDDDDDDDDENGQATTTTNINNNNNHHNSVAWKIQQTQTKHKFLASLPVASGEGSTPYKKKRRTWTGPSDMDSIAEAAAAAAMASGGGGELSVLAQKHQQNMEAFIQQQLVVAEDGGGGGGGGSGSGSGRDAAGNATAPSVVIDDETALYQELAAATVPSQLSRSSEAGDDQSKGAMLVGGTGIAEVILPKHMRGIASSGRGRGGGGGTTTTISRAANHHKNHASASSSAVPKNASVKLSTTASVNPAFRSFNQHHHQQNKQPPGSSSAAAAAAAGRNNNYNRSSGGGEEQAKHSHGVNIPVPSGETGTEDPSNTPALAASASTASASAASASTITVASTTTLTASSAPDDDRVGFAAFRGHKPNQGNRRPVTKQRDQQVFTKFIQRQRR